MSERKIAVLDFYKGTENREVGQLLHLAKETLPKARFDVFNVRSALEFPDLTYAAFLVTGGPGDPRDPEGLFAEMFGQWLDGVLTYNQHHDIKRPVLLICHSFQMACLHWGLADVTQRKSSTFGVYPIHLTDHGAKDPLLGQMADPFFAADFRSFQVVLPREEAIEEMGASLLALEKVRPHVPLERAVMAMRFSPHVLGVQFHPEVPPADMRKALKDPKRREAFIQANGQDKYAKMLNYLNDTSKMYDVYQKLIPGFLTGIEEAAAVS